ncbi:MAG: hypothetical protein M3007_04145 [Candidatus Eremiobacteraeota bacterium]|nr:hypothetical protein [Candidatus Eremiobacteraeota bacterium]
MRKSFGLIKVLLIGFLGGALCGFLILIPAFYFAPAAGVVKDAAWHLTQIEYALTAGVTFGGRLELLLSQFAIIYF